METLQLTQMPEAKTAMLIRRPVAEVFEALSTTSASILSPTVIHEVDAHSSRYLEEGAGCDPAPLWLFPRCVVRQFRDRVAIHRERA
jgi:hypothetical protein